METFFPPDGTIGLKLMILLVLIAPLLTIGAAKVILCGVSAGANHAFGWMSRTVVRTHEEKAQTAIHRV